MPLTPSSTVQIGQQSFDSQQALICICDVICHTATPSWLGSVPSNFADASASTIKADEWHSLITVYLPIALISLWGSGEQAHLKSMLDHTMELVCAVTIVCACTTTIACTEAYCTYIAHYVEKLSTIYPTVRL